MKTRLIGFLALSLFAAGCDDPEPPPAPKPPTALPPPPPPPPKPDGSVCKKLGYEGVGTYASPCVVATSPIAVKWTKSYAKNDLGESVPDFAFENPFDAIVTNAVVTIRYLDAAGKALPVELDGKSLPQVETAGTIVRLSAKSKTFVALGAPEAATPKGTTDIVCEIKSFGWTAPPPETFFSVTSAASASPSASSAASAAPSAGPSPSASAR